MEGRRGSWWIGDLRGAEFGSERKQSLKDRLIKDENGVGEAVERWDKIALWWN